MAEIACRFYYHLVKKRGFMPIENHCDKTISMLLNSHHGIATTSASPPPPYPYPANHALPPPAPHYANLAEYERGHPGYVYISWISDSLHQLAYRANSSVDLHKIIDTFIVQLSLCDYFLDELKSIVYHDLGLYLLGLHQLSAEQNDRRIPPILARMFSNIDQGLAIALNVIPAFYEKINSMVKGAIYEKIWEIKIDFIRKVIFDYVIQTHGKYDNESYVNAYYHLLRDTPWGIDYPDDNKIIKQHNLIEAENSLCRLMKELEQKVTLGKIIIFLGTGIYENICAILKKNCVGMIMFSVMSY
ncbi:hypothetical protein [Acerihabitans sp.]|uniref:hypothetical protein n=1 Tax=Acerihabitans sp. TaxID=2811394 RepID=UPI002EDA7EC7